MAAFITGLTVGALIEAVNRRGVAFMVNGYDRAQKIWEFNGTLTKQNLGLEQIWKDNVLTLSGTTSGSMTGDYAGCITGYNAKTPILLESNPSPIETITGLSSKKLKFAWSASAFDSQVTHVRCYATIAGGAAAFDQMFYVGEAEVATQLLEVDLSDLLIEAGTPLSVRNGAPVGAYAHICLHKERIVMANRTRSLKVSGTATSGGTTTLVSSLLQNYEAAYFVDMWVLLDRGLGGQRYRQITAYDPATGTITFATTTAVTSATTFEVYEEAGPTEVVWSEPDKPEVFPADNVVSIDTGLMDEITGIVSFHSHVIAFSRQKAFRIYVETGTFEVIPVDCGCISARTIKTIRGTVLWLSDRGVVMLRPDWSSDNLTIRLKHDFTDEINADVAYKAVAEYHQERYYLSFATGGSDKNNELWFYDLLTRGWFGPHTYPFKIQSMVSATDANGIQRLYAGCADTDLGDKIKLLDTGLNDLANSQPSKNSGVATGGSTTTIVDALQSWTTDEFIGTPIRITRAGMSLYADAIVTGNTSTTLTFAAIGFTPVAGDAYKLGSFDSILETSELDFGAPHDGKRLLFAHVHLEDQYDAGATFKVGGCRDFEANAFKETDVDKNRCFAKVALVARGKTFRVRIVDSAPDSAGQIRNIIAEAEVDRDQQ